VVVERIGVALRDVSEVVEAGRTAIPVRDAVAGRVAVDVEIRSGAGGLEEKIRHGAAAADGVEVGAPHRIQEFQLLGVAADDPRRTAGPGGEG